MTDAELIRKQAEKIIELEYTVADCTEGLLESQKAYAKLYKDKKESEARATDFARKIKAIEEEIEQYQFDSVTNLVNKIKSILMPDKH